MTIETKTTIQLSDITAFEFECKACGRIVTLPLPLDRPQNVPNHCPCGANQQWMSFGGDTHESLMRLLQYIGRFSKANNEPFGMRLVINVASDRASIAKD